MLYSVSGLNVVFCFCRWYYLPRITSTDLPDNQREIKLGPTMWMLLDPAVGLFKNELSKHGLVFSKLAIPLCNDLRGVFSRLLESPECPCVECEFDPTEEHKDFEARTKHR